MSHIWRGRWYDNAVVPLYAFIGAAVGWAGFMGYRALRGPDVVWTRDNSEPWNTVRNHQTRLYAVNQKFEDGHWRR